MLLCKITCLLQRAFLIPGGHSAASRRVAGGGVSRPSRPHRLTRRGSPVWTCVAAGSLRCAQMTCVTPSLDLLLADSTVKAVAGPFAASTLTMAASASFVDALASGWDDVRCHVGEAHLARE